MRLLFGQGTLVLAEPPDLRLDFVPGLVWSERVGLFARPHIAIRANADWQLHVHANAMHGFTERGTQRPGSAYHEVADQRSWRAMQALLAHTLA